MSPNNDENQIHDLYFNFYFHAVGFAIFSAVNVFVTLPYEENTWRRILRNKRLNFQINLLFCLSNGIEVCSSNYLI